MLTDKDKKQIESWGHFKLNGHLIVCRRIIEMRKEKGIYIPPELIDLEQHYAGLVAKNHEVIDLEIVLPE